MYLLTNSPTVDTPANLQNRSWSLYPVAHAEPNQRVGGPGQFSL